MQISSRSPARVRHSLPLQGEGGFVEFTEKKSPAITRAAMPKLSLTIQYASVAQNLPSRLQLRRWINAALDRDATITLRIVDTKEGRELNRAYRKKDYATNVLTFVYEESPNGVLSGDIVLCAPVIAKEARAQRKPLMHHYAHLVTHGALHLQGYDHEADAAAKVMEQREIALLSRMKIPNPYVS
jgi:probable rRNA maturation factor